MLRDAFEIMIERVQAFAAASAQTCAAKKSML
jgi:hypothetical protein